MILRTKVALLTIAVAALSAVEPLFGQQFRIIPRETLDSLANPAVEAAGTMKFERTKIDAGTIGEDDAPSEYIFRWRNEGDEPLVVLDVRTGCGCAAAKYDRRPVKSGEEGAITVVYHPKGHPGFFSRKISVYTQNGGGPSAVLELTGRVTPSERPVHNYPHEMGPLRLKSNSVRMSRERKSIETIEVFNAGDKELQLSVDTRLLPAGVTAEFVPPRLAPDSRGDIEIGFDPSKAAASMPKQVPIIVEGINAAPSRRTIYLQFE